MLNKTKRLAVLIAVASLSLTIFSCVLQLNDEERQLVGYWNSAEFREIEQDGIPCSLIINEDVHFKSDRKVVSDVDIKMQYLIDDDYSLLVKCTFYCHLEGSWEIENGYLVENYDNVEIELSDVKSTMGEIPEMKNSMEEMIPVLKNEMLGKQRSKILDITSNEMSLKDDEGEVAKYKKIK